MKTRLLIATGLMLAAFVVLIIRIVAINTTKGKEYKQQVLANQSYSSTLIPYRRGDILDGNGTVLATSERVYDIILEPKNILEFEDKQKATTAALKEYFGFTDQEIAGFLADKDSYYVVARKKETFEKVKPFLDFCNSEEGADVTGVRMTEHYIRNYPNGTLACHLIGFSNDNNGTYGIEQGYNDYLNGSNGRQYTYYNTELGRTNAIEAPTNGDNIITSIDTGAQKIVEDKVNAYMSKEGAKNVSVLVMDPKTCRVIALYNSHPFDPNDAYDIEATKYQFKDDAEFAAFKATATDAAQVEALEKVWRNFVLTDVFEPGSTYKTFTIAGALEEDVIKPEDTFFCDGGEKKDTFYISCHAVDVGGHGTQDLAGALANSCNDALMQIAAKEGSDTFDKYQVMFGFGQKTNIDIPGEQSNASLSSVVYHADTLNETELATSSFGQGVCVSMIQLGTAFCSTINGGYYYQPSVATKIVDEKGNVIDNLDPVLVRRTVSADVSAEMRKELAGVVEDGTGRRCAVEGYTIGGKTGTAEKLPRGNGKYLISFIGFAPVDDPQIVIYVVVDEPHVEDQGSSAASSYLFADIARDLFPYLNIYKEGDDYNVDQTNLVDEVGGPVYRGDAPENDVAGGDENTYVQEAPEAEASEEEDSEGDSEEETPEDEGGDEEEFTDEDGDGIPDEWG